MHIYEQPWFSKIIRPSRYLGGEINSIVKDHNKIDVSIALAFPDVYEVGMSHVGLKILYHILNSKDWIAAERVFSPWVDLEHELIKNTIPLPSLESGKPLSDFDIIGFSLQHEMCYTNVLSMLFLAGIPFLSKNRNSLNPLIIAGGPACFNPEPVADLFDAIVIGEGEDVIVSICGALKEWKSGGYENGKFELLNAISRYRGVYIPSFFKPLYKPDGVTESIKPLIKGYEYVEKIAVNDLNDYPFPSKQIVPYTGLIHDRFTIEIARGCSRGCRFCQAGMIYRPVRERDPLGLLKIAEEGLKGTGFEELSLLSLSSGDYSCVIPLLKELMKRFSERHIAVSFPSLRVDSSISSLVKEIKKVRKTSFTIAPEAGNNRLRDIINKGITDDQILNTSMQIYKEGWNLIKLYFMIGLPFETDEDLLSIVELSKRVSRLAPHGKKGSILNVSLSPFVPKAHTPFAWLPQVTLEESRRKINIIKGRLQSNRMRVKWNNPESSWLEGIFSRGDRKLTRVLIDAWKQGARFDSWTEHFNINVWRKTFKQNNIDPDLYLVRQRDHNEALPWDHIHSGISKESLLREWKKAVRMEKTSDCREYCSDCGVCKKSGDSLVLFTKWNKPDEKSLSPFKNVEKGIRKYRIVFSKLDRAKYLSHLEFSRVLTRAFRRAGIDMVYTGGYHPMPKISFAQALPVGTESFSEVMDIQVNMNNGESLSPDRLVYELPYGINLIEASEISINTPPPQVRENSYNIKVNGLLKKGNADKFLYSDEFILSKKRRKGEIKVDIRSQVKSIKLLSDNELDLIVINNTGGGMSPNEIVRGIFNLSHEQAERMKIIKLRSILK